MPKTTADLRSLCRGFTEKTVEIIGGFATSPDIKPAIRVQAIAMLWERGYGKAPQAHTGEDGEGDIRVVIRHILERESPRQVETKSVSLEPPKPNGSDHGR